MAVRSLLIAFHTFLTAASLGKESITTCPPNSPQRSHSSLAISLTSFLRAYFFFMSLLPEIGCSYFIVGGLVFMRLTLPFLHEWGDDWWNTAPRRLVDKVSGNLRRTSADEELVILSYILVDQINYGYSYGCVCACCLNVAVIQRSPTLCYYGLMERKSATSRTCSAWSRRRSSPIIASTLRAMGPCFKYAHRS